MNEKLEEYIAKSKADEQESRNQLLISEGLYYDVRLPENENPTESSIYGIHPKDNEYHYFTRYAEELTEEEKKMLERAEKASIIFDEDCPELTEEQLKQFRRVSERRKSENRKETVTLRLSAKSLRKAKSLGKGYTAVLSRILEDALNDNEVIFKHM